MRIRRKRSRRRRAPKVGDIISERYQIEHLLGEGGYAWVYLTINPEIPSIRRALKVLKPEHVQDKAVMGRFRREAETAALLENRHVVRVLDFGETDGGLPYIAMEYVEGETLEGLIQRFGCIRTSDTSRFALGILEALTVAHRFGVVHRDLKPANVIVQQVTDKKHPIARVTDFGIAKLLHSTKKDNWTVDSIVLCTPNYAAPELLRGDPSTQSDLYALGHMMAQMLEGYTPYFRGSAIEVATKHLVDEEAPFGPRTRQSPLHHVIAKACEKDEKKRYQTATDMHNDLKTTCQYIPSMVTDKPLELIMKIEASPIQSLDPPNYTSSNGYTPFGVDPTESAKTDRMDKIDVSWADDL